MKKFLGDGGTVSEFFKMVDIRTYDLNNKQNDIKLVKTIDFIGVYVLQNQTKISSLLVRVHMLLEKLKDKLEVLKIKIFMMILKTVINI